jgi:hypothetical protein
LYSAENLDEELEQATRPYINSPQGSKLDRDRNVLSISMIFKWYMKDFEKVDEKVSNFVAQYLPEEDRKYVKDNSDTLAIEYMDYDWSLNVQ